MKSASPSAGVQEVDTTTATKGERSAPGSEVCWELLERLAASSHLKRAARLQELLLYIGNRSLKDGCNRLQEHEIGTSVFGRPASYDTTVDNIVRSSVSDLRRRIEAYFNSEGANEPLLMEIPRGSYLPAFLYRSPPPEAIAEATNQPPGPGPKAEQLTESPETSLESSRALWLRIDMMIAGLCIAALVVASLFFWSQYHALRHSVYPWEQEPSVEAFWSRIVSANPETDVVISDASIGIVEALTQRRFSLSEYLARSYVDQLKSADMAPEMHSTLNRILSWNLANPDEFVLARRILALDPPGRKFRFYNARNYTADLIKRDNVILLGARKSNPWDELFGNQMNFITEVDSSPRVINRVPISGEQPVYANSDSVGYCVVAFMPKPDQSGVVLLIEGTNAEATEAAGDFLLSEDQLSSFKKKLHVSEIPYFQALLKVSYVRGTPLTATIEAYRSYHGVR